MNRSIVILIALPLVLPATVPAGAGSIEDIVRTNCTKQILASTDVSPNAIKTFRISKHGDGYTMTGQNEEKQTVTCEAASDGHVTWVRAG